MAHDREERRGERRRESDVKGIHQKISASVPLMLKGMKERISSSR
jgi:hypothetical protein